MNPLRIIAFTFLVIFFLFDISEGNELFGRPSLASDDPFEEKVHRFVKKILAQEPFTFSEEKEYFGPNGRNFGEALYKALGIGDTSKQYPYLFQVKEKPVYSPLGIIFSKKIYPLLKDSQYYFYTLGEPRLFHIKSGVLRGFTPNPFMTIVFQNSNWQDNVPENILLLSLYLPCKNKEDFFFDLHNSYINGMRLDRFLGFERTRVEGVYHVPEDLLKDIKKYLMLSAKELK